MHKTFEELGFKVGDLVLCTKSGHAAYKVDNKYLLTVDEDGDLGFDWDDSQVHGYLADWELLESSFYRQNSTSTNITNESDPVEKPAHYNQSSIECIDYLEDNMPHEAFIGYLEGNTKKYLHRWRYKDKPVEDLKKALWYLDRTIKAMEKTDG